MKEKHLSFLNELLVTPSPTGSEMLGQRVWANYMKPLADEVNNDAYGNTWAVHKGKGGENGLKVMLEAHADEIGFMISYISDDGFLSVVSVGDTDVAISRGKRVVFAGEKGDVKGIIANTAIHLRRDSVVAEKAPKWHEIFIDIGATSKEEVLNRGLRVGIFGVYDVEPIQLSEDRLVSRAVDNRISGYILARVYENLKEENTQTVATVLAVNAVQEEVGGNGAVMIANRLFPEVAIVFDVTHATDTPGIDKKKFGDVKLGGGPALAHGAANHPLVVERLMKIAEREGIAVQHEAISRFSGTDTDKIFVVKTGIPSALISIPLRYMHSPVETVDMNDVENTIKLVTAFVKDLKSDERFSQAL